MKSFWEKIWKKYSVMFITIIVTIISQNMISVSDITKNIADNSLTSHDCITFVFQELLVIILSFIMGYGINAIRKYNYRNRIRKNKFNPLQYMTISDKRSQIEYALNENHKYATLVQSNNGKNKIYYYKQLLYSLERSMRILLNLINYKDMCITKETDIPTDVKFSFMDIYYYIQEVNGCISVINQDDLEKMQTNEIYEENEIKFLKELIKDTKKQLGRLNTFVDKSNI